MSTRRSAQKPPRWRRARSLIIEQLESRRLLVGNALDPQELVWPKSTRVAIELLVTDQYGFPISQVEKGGTFKLQAWTHEFAPGRVRDAGTYAAYVDVVFDASLASVSGVIDHGTTFHKGRSGTVTPGLLHEVGGFRDLENGPSLSTGLGFTGVRLFEVNMSADSLGRLAFTANPADELPAHQTVLVRKTLTANGTPEYKFSSIPPDFVPPSGTLVNDEEDPIAAEDAFYGEVNLEIVAPGSLEVAPRQNRLNPFDTNTDGKVTPADIMPVFTEIWCRRVHDVDGCNTLYSFRSDINGDGDITRNDVLHVVNYDINAPIAGADVYVAPIGQSLAISAADGVLRNDFTTEGAVVTATLQDRPDGLTLSGDGSFVWTPPEGFDDDQVEFVYSASDGKRSANAKARILMRDIDDEQVIVSLRTVDETGQPITEAVPGDTFFVEAYVEDTRPRPEGVFAAYIDVAFDSELASVAGPLKFGKEFPNARHGSAGPGLLDEVGGLQQPDDHLGGGGKLLFSIPLKAESEGELTFATDMSDTFPDHYMLLLGIDHPIAAELIRFESLSLDIIDTNRAPIAEPDRYSGPPGAQLSISAAIGVLANDQDKDKDNLSASLVEGPTHGTLSLHPSGSFSYTPDAGFTGTDSFTYVANDGELDSQTTSVTIDVRPPSDPVVAFRLQVLNDEGQPVDRVTVGDEFELRVVMEDVRERPQGVFSAYLDVEYNASLVSTVGDVAFGDTYNKGREATHAVGLIDEVGAFTGQLRPVGGGEFFLFSQRFTATSAGQVLFASNPADFLPAHVVLVYGLNDEVDPGDIDFGSAEVVTVPSAELAFTSFSLRVLAEGEQPLGVADVFAVNYEVAGQSLDVLANDSSAVIAITAVTGAIGSVNIAPDGKSLLYSAPADFAGKDRFTYTVTDSAGNTDVVAVDVQVKSPFQNFDHPTDTDADGHVAPIDALYGVNELNRNGSRRLTDADAIGQGLSYFLDVDGDLHLAPLDILVIINELNARAAANAEGESSALLLTGDDEGVEADQPSIVVPDLVSGLNTDDVERWSSLARFPTSSEQFFARFATDAEPLLEDDLFESL
jgi:VCBS repeat-containing protein